jgi:hypothetical protein
MLIRFPRAASRFLLLAVLVTAGCGRTAQVSSPGGTAGPAPQDIPVNDGESLIRAMYARYQGKWYHTLTFIQQTQTTRGSSPPQTQTWYEALSLPGLLRIDFGNPDAHSGVLFRADSTYQFNSGTATRADTGWNELMVLGFDVYTQPPDKTISILRHLGYQLSRFHSSSYDDKAAWVVGATSTTDSTSKQFWVERDRLVFMRGREKRPSGESEVWFRNYAKAGNGWVAKLVVQLSNGQPTLREDYSNVVADPPLDPALFDPKQWATIKHWSKP